MDERIIEHCRRKYSVLIGERTAESVKIEIGSAFPLANPMTMEVKGRDLVAGIPKTLTLNDTEIREALTGCVTGIIEAIRVALERTPAELSGDIADRGIVLTGGGALLKNLDARIKKDIGLCVSVADDPLTCVAIGAGQVLSDFNLLRRVSMN
jgi:rod shape-determining protein MreB